MSDMVKLSVDGVQVEAPAGASVMDACDLAGAYVPRLCAYPGLEPAGDCGLCFVHLTGEGLTAGARRACSVTVQPGMVVDTQDREAAGFRLSSMKAILGDHPHACLDCPLRDGCSRDECMYGNPPEARCCGEFGRCEIAKVAAYVGGLQGAPPYAFRSLGVSVDHNVRRDLDLCIGCGRCVAACDTLPEAGAALRLVETRTLVISAAAGGGSPEWTPQSYLGRHVAVPTSADGDLRASGCTFCGACVMVCPSGALTAAGPRRLSKSDPSPPGGDGRGRDKDAGSWLAKRRERSTLRAPVLPPTERLSFTAETVTSLVPAAAGVFQLFSPSGDVLQISGVVDLRAALTGALTDSLARDAVAFVFEVEPMYTQRESELLARHMQTRGGMPRGNDVFEDPAADDDAGQT